MANPAGSIMAGEQPSLRYLFFVFLKVGAVSFGGNMALIAVVKSIMVDKDKTLRHEIILEALSIGSLLPGPLAVNIVAYIGYSLRKGMGAVVSMVGILLPAVGAMLILSWLYFSFGWNQKLSGIMPYITGAVAAIIFSTALQFYQKDLKGSWLKKGLAILGAASVLLNNSFVTTILVLLAGAVAGRLQQMTATNKQDEIMEYATATKTRFSASTIITLVMLAVLLLLFLTEAYKLIPGIVASIIVVFSGISLSLFGGGYVMIPIMQSLFVNELLWITRQEFLDAIAFSQVTPGPILVSATFIGYKLYGVPGALIATVSIFAPSAALMILVSKVYGKIRHLSTVKPVLAGVKAVVIGLIAGAAIKIGVQISWNVFLIIVSLAAFILSFFYKTSPVHIILVCILVGVVMWFFNIG